MIKIVTCIIHFHSVGSYGNYGGNYNNSSYNNSANNVNSNDPDWWDK